MKYKIGDLVWDRTFNEFGIIIDVRDNLYRIRWCTGNIQESWECGKDISPHPVKDLLTTERTLF